VKRIDANRIQAEAEGVTGQPRVGQVAIPAGPATPTAQPSAASPKRPDETASGGLFPNPPPKGFDDFLAKVPAMPPSAPSSVTGWAGVTIQDLTPELAQTLKLPPDKVGIVVADVDANGPAERAGLLAGDVILDVDGQVSVPRQLVDKVRQSPVGTLLRLRIWRNGQHMFIALRTVSKP